MKLQLTALMKCAALAAVLATLLPRLGHSAVSANDSLTPSLAAPAAQEDASLLNRRLISAKKDLEQFLVFAEHFAASGDTRSVEQLQVPVNDFLKRHVANLLAQAAEQTDLETVRISAEIMFIKTRLLLNLNLPEPAGATLADMKKRFGPYQKNTIQVSGKSTTLNEAMRLLDEELTRTVSIKKK